MPIPKPCHGSGHCQRLAGRISAHTPRVPASLHHRAPVAACHCSTANCYYSILVSTWSPKGVTSRISLKNSHHPLPSSRHANSEVWITSTRTCGHADLTAWTADELFRIRESTKGAVLWSPMWRTRAGGHHQHRCGSALRGRCARSQLQG